MYTRKIIFFRYTVVNILHTGDDDDDDDNNNNNNNFIYYIG